MSVHPLNVSRLLLSLLFVATAAILPSDSARADDDADAQPPMNLVLFVTDDQSTTLGCYGDPVAKTPAVDRLAKEGTRFTHVFATTASCSASRSVILTGLHNHANAHYGHEHAYHHFRSYERIQSLP
ncbi:MAG: sulfatase-like hydrolase/transferase, partial [Pirellulales bacterium]